MGGAADYAVITSDLVNLFITSNISSFTSEKRFDKSLTVGDLKVKLELISGGTAASMGLSIFDKENKLMYTLDDNNALLGSYHIEDGHRIHVIDENKQKGEFENTAAVEKFELTKDQYNKRTDTVAAFLKKNNLGKYNEEEMAALAKEKEDREAAEERLVAEKGMVAGARCQVTTGGAGKRRGTVQFAGKVHFQPGTWVGIQYDEPTGKNDGSVGGQRYFTCPPKFGGFVKPNCVEVGDFPEEDLDFSDGEM